jgi:nitronate monooxygenase
LPRDQLLREIVDTVDVPVAASGGITDGGGLAAALAAGAAGVHCGTVFLAATESFAHDFHKQRLITAEPGDTVLTDLFAINWPPHAAVRVLKNSVTAEIGNNLWGHHPDLLPREAIGDEDGRAIYKFSTDSPLQSMTGDFEKMALYAGTGAGRERSIRPAAEILNEMIATAVARTERLGTLLVKDEPRK